MQEKKRASTQDAVTESLKTLTSKTAQTIFHPVDSMKQLLTPKKQKPKITPGLSPGELTFVGKQKVIQVQITLHKYTSTQITEHTYESISEAIRAIKSKKNDKKTKYWLQITGLHNTEMLELLGKTFDIHALTLEDILDTTQRPKCDITEQHIFTTNKIIQYNKHTKRLEFEQLSMILTQSVLISFQESPTTIFKPLLARMHKKKSKTRHMGVDYLMYALLDIIVDNYFVTIEHMGEQIEEIEEQLISKIKHELLNDIYQLKREMLLLRKSVWPMREIVSRLERDETKYIKTQTKPYLRDLYDHTIHIIDAIETNRDLLSGMLDLFLSSISNKMNEVMKVLTIIATIFIPLTFIAGVYGMNFEFMPELTWEWGYFGIMAFMTVIALTMLYLFKRNKWI